MNKYIYVLIALVVAFAAGRYSVPINVKTDTTASSKETEKKSENTNTQKHTKTTIVDTTNPDGSKSHTVTKETELNNEKKTTETSANTRSETSSKEVARAGSRLNISALAGSKISSISTSGLELDYGAMVSRDLIGPISVGAFGFKSGVAGVAVGITF